MTSALKGNMSSCLRRRDFISNRWQFKISCLCSHTHLRFVGPLQSGTAYSVRISLGTLRSMIAKSRSSIGFGARWLALEPHQTIHAEGLDEFFENHCTLNFRLGQTNNESFTAWNDQQFTNLGHRELSMINTFWALHGVTTELHFIVVVIWVRYVKSW